MTAFTRTGESKYIAELFHNWLEYYDLCRDVRNPHQMDLIRSVAKIMHPTSFEVFLVFFRALLHLLMLIYDENLDSLMDVICITRKQMKLQIEKYRDMGVTKQMSVAC